MSDTIWIALIIAATVIMVLALFRSRLRSFGIKAGSDGVEARLKANSTSKDQNESVSPKKGVSIVGNEMIGERQSINVGRDNAEVRDNVVKGRDQSLEVKR